ncbi:efflux RND transporter periplasmic adaptor subunit [Sphingobacterium sp. BIGb0116]|uniref:efflux RND transporter periplasmic adaptor subunit n=1 Tax=Sphingobacterium sp. BIGb0116 TaxID=2940619 RepID=UPI002168BBCF|nr:efflux RND transporter periplasmic adaptor subunit [Sphingobacterium sp. BIGb0116]MCS4164120.1 cobalt-zinc-cadmium efflux system membrane fusion protein [Sphingobacterium sp. BIGb0116]
MNWIPVLLLLQACNSQSHESPNQSPAISAAGDTVTVSENTSLLSKLKFVTTTHAQHALKLNAAATVKIIPSSYVEIPVPFAGRIVKSHVKLGQKVTINTPLFSISSSDYFEAQRAYLDAKQAFMLAENMLKRQKDLIAHGVGTKKELEEAETNFAMSNAALGNATAALKIFDSNPSHSVLGEPLLVRSPIQGEILSSSIVLGQYTKEDAPALLRIAELSKVWVSAYIKEKDLPAIDQLARVEVSVDALPAKKIPGKIVHINQFVDEASRNIEVLIACENTDRALKPGMYVNAEFERQTTPTLFIPAKAVFQFNDKSFVWVKTSSNTFVKRFVTTGVTEGDAIQILTGLVPQEQIVGEGAFYLTPGL